MKNLSLYILFDINLTTKQNFFIFILNTLIVIILITSSYNNDFNEILHFCISHLKELKTVN